MNRTLSHYVDITFHAAATATAQGKVEENNGYSYLVVEVQRSAGTSTVKFKGSLTTDTLANMTAITGLKMSDYTTRADNTTGTGEIWLIDIRGLKYVCCELFAVSGGNVTVKGRLIA